MSLGLIYLAVSPASLEEKESTEWTVTKPCTFTQGTANKSSGGDESPSGDKLNDGHLMPVSLQLQGLLQHKNMVLKY